MYNVYVLVSVVHGYLDLIGASFIRVYEYCVMTSCLSMVQSLVVFF